MENIATKENGSILTPEEFNQIPEELENAISSSGQILSSNDTSQLAKTIVAYANAGASYDVGGTANNLVLTPHNDFIPPIKYYQNMIINFIPTIKNTSAVSISISGLTSVSLKDSNNQDLAANKLIIGAPYSAYFNGTNFQLIELGAAIDGSNITNDFSTNVFRNKISNIILSYLNSGITYSGVTFTVKSGFQVLIPNGRDTYNNLNSTELYISQDFTSNVTSSNGTYYLFMRSNKTLVWANNYSESLDVETIDSSKVEAYYNITQNKMYYHAKNASSWTQYLMVYLGTFTISNNIISNIKLNYPMRLDNFNTVNISGNQTINGVKEYTSSPLIPTPSSGDNSNKAANTAFVKTIVDTKQATITGGATTITSSNLTTNRALISNSSGKVAVSAVTSAELGYLSGVTSAIQTQLNNCVHINGTETINGLKTFGNNINLLASAFSYRHIYSDNTSITKGTAPSTNTGFDYVLRDSANSNISSFSGWYNTNGDITAALYAYTPTSGSTTHADLRVCNYAAGRADVVFSTPTGVENSCLSAETNSAASTMFPTKGWVNNPATSTNVVHRTGNETIGGTKTFSSNPAIQNNTPALYLNSMDIIKGTAPSETQYAGIAFRDSTGDIKGSLARILTGYQTNKESFISLYAYKSDTTPATEAGLIGDSVTMHYPATGNPYATAPSSDVANSIVTTVNKSKAANGYFQLGNGLIIQWGKSTATSSSGSVTLPKAFSSTNYAVVINDVMANVPSSQGSNANVVGWGVVQSRSTTAFTAFLCNYENSTWWAYKESGRTFTWIAIGY